MRIKSVYLIGSLRNPKIPVIGNLLRKKGFEVFEDWFSAGKIADDSWQAYETGRGHTYDQALKGYAAQHVFNFDRKHLNRCDAVVLAMPAGKSGHLELGYSIGRGKRGYILMDKKPDRFDVMYNFASAVCFDMKTLVKHLRKR